jgi:hypothetical protein
MRAPVTSRNAALGAMVLLLGGCAATPERLTASNETALEQCEPSIGTRIRSSNPTDCGTSTSPTKTFSADEIRATGEFDLAEALRRLDPTFR